MGYLELVVGFLFIVLVSIIVGFGAEALHDYLK